MNTICISNFSADCPAITVNNGSPSTASVDYAVSVNIVCDVGYTDLIGQAQVTCQADGTWSHDIPTCNSK